MSDLNILSRHRRHAFDSIPKLSGDDRTVYISENRQTKQHLRNKNSHRKVGFLLHRSYFSAKGRFFDLDGAYKRDIKFALKRLGLPSTFQFDPSKYSKTLQNEDKQVILKEIGWQAYQAQFSNDLIDHAKHLVSRRLSREAVLFALVDYCWARRTTIPSYSVLAGIVTNAFRDFESEVMSAWSINCDEDVRNQLTSLVRSHKVSNTFKNLRKIDQDDSLRSMLSNAHLLEFARDLFLSAEPSLKPLKLTQKALSILQKRLLNTISLNYEDAKMIIN